MLDWQLCQLCYPLEIKLLLFMMRQRFITHGVQRRMISVDNFFVFLRLLLLLCCCYIRPSARCGGYVWPSLSVNSIWKSFLKYE